jgi:LysR family glycine cleavage system transcriptional activator
MVSNQDFSSIGIGKLILMRKPLPSLNALKAFEAAARHNGYIAAADELCVTRGAVSRHVKLLEDQLGVPLFVRHAKGVELTPAGAKLLPILSDAFEHIGQGLDRVMSPSNELRVICTPSISIRWLIPKLDRFRKCHPEIEVRLSTGFYGARGFNPRENDIGFSVMVWPGRSPEVDAVPLFPMRQTPACAPRVLSGSAPLAKPADLAQHRLLHESDLREDWPFWATQFDQTGLDPKSGDAFPSLDMATKAAVMGSGVVMVDLVLCRQELVSGTLVTPFPTMIAEGQHGDYCLLIDKTRRDDPKVAAFVDWACSEAKQDRADLERST